MADDKNFEGTPARIARARREGDVPRSSDAVAVASFASACAATVAVLPALRDGSRLALLDASAGADARAPYVLMACAVLGVLAAALAGSLLATYLQTRAFVFAAPVPKMKKLDPLAGLRRMFGRDAAVAALKASLVAACLVAVLVPVVRDAVLAQAVTFEPGTLAARTFAAASGALESTILVGGAFAALDVLVERAKWRRRLRMSFDEVKRDHKQSDGDPQLRGRRRQAHRALARGGVARVREAAFVVTNPTHLAIALAYDPPRVSVPCVLVRAADAVAASVRAEAKRRGIPIVENVALARALFEAADVGQAIPSETYLAVAQIVASLGSRVRETA